MVDVIDEFFLYFFDFGVVFGSRIVVELMVLYYDLFLFWLFFVVSVRK